MQRLVNLGTWGSDSCRTSSTLCNTGYKDPVTWGTAPDACGWYLQDVCDRRGTPGPAKREQRTIPSARHHGWQPGVTLASGVADKISEAEVVWHPGPQRYAALLLPVLAEWTITHAGSPNVHGEVRMLLTRFFPAKKTIKPHQLGHVLYRALHRDFASRSALSPAVLLERLVVTEADLVVGYQTEISLSLMSHARYAVDYTYGVPVAEAIVHGMTEAFVAHTQDRGATQEPCTTFASLFEVRSHEYAQAGKNKLLYDHAYWRGKVLFEKMTGGHNDARDPMTRLQVAICSAFLTESFLAIHTVLQQYKVAA